MERPPKIEREPCTCNLPGTPGTICPTCGGVRPDLVDEEVSANIKAHFKKERSASSRPNKKKAAPSLHSRPQSPRRAESGGEDEFNIKIREGDTYMLDPDEESDEVWE